MKSGPRSVLRGIFSSLATVQTRGVAIVCSLCLMACAPTSGTDAIAQNSPQTLSQTPSSSSQLESQAAGVTVQGAPPEWADTATEVMEELAQWRGLPFTNDLQVTFAPPDDPSLDGLNGWYNSESKELVVSLNESEAMSRGVLLHEIFHALQDQHFDLYKLHSQSVDEPDYDKAVSAMIEGEAMLAVSEILDYDFLTHARLPVDGEISEDFFESVFLYGAGLKFIKAIREEGGWDAVDAAFKRPPQATTLILHPERYLTGDRTIAPIEVPLKTGETLRSQTMRGEYEVQWLLARSPETRPLLVQVEDGYVADTLAMVSTEDGETRHRWVVEFESADVAEALVTGIEQALINATPDLGAPDLGASDLGASDGETTVAPVVSVVQTAIVAEW